VAERPDRAPQYLVGRIENGLAHEPRLHELGVHVEAVADELVLTGEVATPERRLMVGEIARALAGGRRVRNETTVVACAPPDEIERVP
jgi:hypothetical protein